jgi:predicted dehydrogenase
MSEIKATTATTRKLTRREFAKGTALTAASLAFPMVASARVFGRGAPSNRVTLGMIGVGQRGTDVMKGFARHEDVQLLAVCDPSRHRREAAKAWLNDKYGDRVAEAYNDFREMLARDDIDGVVVCTPDHWHIPAAIYAAQAGKDMYVEKPLGVSLSWAWRLREAVRRYGSVFQYGTQQRSDWRFRFACELARNQYIGELQRIEVWCPDVSDDWSSFSVKRYGSTEPAPVPEGFDYDLWLGPAPMTPYTVDRCRREGSFHIYDYALGFVAGWGAHPLDIAQWAMNADNSGPVYYEGRGEIPAKGLLDTITWWDVHWEYASGVKLHFMCHRLAQPIVMKYRDRWSGHGTTFFGSKGRVSVDRGGICADDPRLLQVKLRPGDVRLYRSPGQDRNFVDCVKRRKPTVSPLESAIRSDTISHLSDIAIRAGRPIRWDPHKEEIIGDEQAGRVLSRPSRAPWRL